MSALVRKLEQWDVLSPTEQSSLENSIVRVREVRADVDIVALGSRPSDSSVLAEGFAARYKTLNDGRRQITAFHIPGDFVDLHSFLLHTMDHAVTALTPCRVGVVPHQNLRLITETQPHLARLLWLSTIVDGAIHREWLFAMGRMAALGHMAHLICEFYLRLRAVDLVADNSFKLPITQTELGDALGLSTVHVNRTLQELRSDNLIVWRGDTVTILDWKRLSEVAEFDETYIQHNREPR